MPKVLQYDAYRKARKTQFKKHKLKRKRLSVKNAEIIAHIKNENIEEYVYG